MVFHDKNKDSAKMYFILHCEQGHLYICIDVIISGLYYIITFDELLCRRKEDFYIIELNY